MFAGTKAATRWTITFILLAFVSAPMAFLSILLMFLDLRFHMYSDQNDYTAYVWMDRIPQTEFGAWNLALMLILSQFDRLARADYILVITLVMMLFASVKIIQSLFLNGNLEHCQKIFYQVWQLVVHTVCSVWALSLVGPSWLVDWTASLERGCKLMLDNALEESIHTFMLFQMGIWVYTAISCLYLESKRKDFRVMMSHHLLTIMMVGISMIYGFEFQGLQVLIIHDASDVLLDLSKLANYLKCETTAGISFALTTCVVWPVLRLFVFPLWIDHLIRDCHDLVETIPKCVAMTIVLLCLHWWWWGLMLKILRDVLVGKSTVQAGEEHYE